MVGHRRRLPRRPHLHARGLRQTHFRGVLLGAGLPVERRDRHQASASRPRLRSPAQGIQAAHVPHRRYRSPRRRPAAAPRRTGHASSSGGPPREAAAGESQRLLSRAPYRPPCAGACTTLKSLAEAEIDSWEEADKAPSCSAYRSCRPTASRPGTRRRRTPSISPERHAAWQPTTGRGVVVRDIWHRRWPRLLRSRRTV